MTRTRSLFAAAVLALSVPAAIAGCGDDGGSSDEDPQEVVDAIFNNDETVTSGVLDISVDASAGDQGTFEASISGPFQGVADDPTAIPQLDLTASVSGEGAGQSVNFEGGLVVTEDNAFVEYEGETYEVGTDTFSQFKEAAEASAGQAGGTTGEQGDASASFREGCEQAVEAQGGDPSACDFDPGAWFTDLTNDGTEDLDGTETNHISGEVDVTQMLQDVIGIAQSVPGASGQVDEAQVDQVGEAITEAAFDIYGGVDDDLLRKLDVNVTIDPSAIEGAELVPVESVDFGFSVGISGVNEEQTIDAPADAKPLEDLLGQFGLGGLGPLGGSGLDLGGGGGGFDLDSGSGGGGNSDAYLDCVAEAGNDPQEAAKCLDQL